MFNFTNCNVTISRGAESQTTNDNKTEVITKLEVELTNLRDVVKAKDEAITKLEVEIKNQDELKANLYSANGVVAKLTKEISDKAQLDDLKASVSINIEELEKEHQLAIDMMTTALDGKDATIKEYAKKIQTAKDKLVKLSTTIDSKDKSIRNLNMQVQTVSEDIISKDATIKLLKDKLDDLTNNTLDSKDATIKMLQGKLDTQSTIISDLNKKIATLQDTATPNKDKQDTVTTKEIKIPIIKKPIILTKEPIKEPKTYNRVVPLDNKLLKSMNFNYLPENATHTCTEEITDCILAYTKHDADYLVNTYTNFKLSELADGTNVEMIEHFNFSDFELTTEQESEYNTKMLMMYFMLVTLATVNEIENEPVKNFNDILAKADKLFPTADIVLPRDDKKEVNALGHGKGDNKPQLLGHTTIGIDEKLCSATSLSSATSSALHPINEVMKEYIYELGLVKEVDLPTAKMIENEKVHTAKGKRTSAKKALLRGFEDIVKALKTDEVLYKDILANLPSVSSKSSRGILILEIRNSLLLPIAKIHAMPTPPNKDNSDDKPTLNTQDTIYALTKGTLDNDKLNSLVSDIECNVSLMGNKSLYAYSEESFETQLIEMNKTTPSKTYTMSNNNDIKIVKDEVTYIFRGVKESLRVTYMLIDSSELSKTDNPENLCDIILGDYELDGDAPELLVSTYNIEDMIKTFNDKNDGDTYTIDTSFEHSIIKSENEYIFKSVIVTPTEDTKEDTKDTESLKAFQTRLKKEFKDHKNFNSVKSFLDYTPTVATILNKFIGKLTFFGVRKFYVAMMAITNRRNLSEEQLLSLYKDSMNYIFSK